VVRVRAGGTDRVNIAGLARFRPGYRSRLIYRLRTWRARKGEPKSLQPNDCCVLLAVVHVPTYAPDLNPVEGIWSTLKANLVNFTAIDLDHLINTVRQQLKRIQDRPPLIDGYLTQTGLTLNPPGPTTPGPHPLIRYSVRATSLQFDSTG
jgi:hypothetical protein